MISQAVEADKELEQFGYVPKLHRALTAWQLTSFGLTYLQPIGPAVVFGFLLTTSQGSVALPYLFAFIGMIFTILSYSVLIKEYPLSGSIYNYVKFIGGDFWGFIAGWLLALDYVLIPTITSVSAAIYAHQLIPSVSYESWLITFVLGMGLLNLIGIKSTSFFSSAMLLIQIVIVLLGFAIWIYFLSHTKGVGSLFSIKPFHFESITGVIQASSLAIFSFLGFDAVTTLAEESVNPRKDIPRAMLLCTCIGFAIMFLTGYLGVLLVPDWKNLISDPSWINATLFNVAEMTGGQSFAFVYTVGFIFAMVVTNLVGTAAATRLLYGMGRDNKIPQRIFGAVNKKWKTPHGNIIFIILIELVLGSVANQDQLAELINYGAISGFIILNFSVIWLGYKIATKKVELKSFALDTASRMDFFLRFIFYPSIAVVIMIAIFVNMKVITIIFGTLWAAIGMLYCCINKAYKLK
jgi:putrescine importer